MYNGSKLTKSASDTIIENIEKSYLHDFQKQDYISKIKNRTSFAGNEKDTISDNIVNTKYNLIDDNLIAKSNLTDNISDLNNDILIKDFVPDTNFGSKVFEDLGFGYGFF